MNVGNRWNDLFEKSRPYLDSPDHHWSFADGHLMFLACHSKTEDASKKLLESAKNFVRFVSSLRAHTAVFFCFCDHPLKAFVGSLVFTTVTSRFTLGIGKVASISFSVQGSGSFARKEHEFLSLLFSWTLKLKTLLQRANRGQQKHHGEHWIAFAGIYTRM